MENEERQDIQGQEQQEQHIDELAEFKNSDGDFDADKIKKLVEDKNIIVLRFLN